MNLPNRLSIFRMVLVPLIVVIWIFPYAQFGINMPVYTLGIVTLPLVNLIDLLLFIIASITDFLDGFIARSQNMVTSFGKFIDPIADKALTTTMFVLLAVKGTIPAVPVLIMLWRDTIVDGIRMVAAEHNEVMAAGMLGKIKTTLQMFCIIFTLLNNYPFELIGFPFSTILLWAATIISVLGGLDYFKQAKKFIMESM